MGLFIGAFLAGLIAIGLYALFVLTFQLVVLVGLPLAGYALMWLLRCFGMALRLAGRGALAAAYAARRGLKAAGLFVYLLIDELRRGAADDEDAADDAAADQAADHTAYETALKRFGLPDRFSEGDLNRAYKTEMLRAHPDRGGSDEQAQDLNAARDVIRHAHGWA